MNKKKNSYNIKGLNLNRQLSTEAIRKFDQEQINRKLGLDKKDKQAKPPPKKRQRGDSFTRQTKNEGTKVQKKEQEFESNAQALEKNLQN